MARPVPTEAAGDLQRRTIDDFGEQWTRYTDNEGYYGSAEYFHHVFGPLLTADVVAGRRVCEIGAGTGRFVNIFLEYGAAHVVAVEPSAAFDVLTANTASHADRITYLRCRGDELPSDLALDYVFSIGVLHHIPDPAPVMAAAFDALRPGGTIAIWVYGREGNAAYLAVLNTMRLFTRSLPHRLLEAFVRVIDVPTLVYIGLCRFLPLPLARYMTQVLGRLDGQKRRVVMYDQLNPAYAKYYRRDEVERLLAGAGFQDVQLYHRGGYSWAATGRKRWTQ